MTKVDDDNAVFLVKIGQVAPTPTPLPTKKAEE